MAAGRFRGNLAANLVGFGVSALLPLAFVPVYVRTMGIEGYGLVGFMAMLVGLLQALDLGLSMVVNREMARRAAQADRAADTRDLVLTLEAICLAMSALIGVALLTASGYIARRWITPGALALAEVEQAVILMAVLAALQWPVSFFHSAIMGLERQVLLNLAKVGWTMASYAGGALVLWTISASVGAYFKWQIVVSAVNLVLLHLFLWRSLPRARRAARLRPGLVRGVWRFAAGMTGMNFCSVIITHADRVVLSRMLNLQMFGYYTLAWSLARGVLAFVQPVFGAAFPRLSALVAAGDESAVRQLYQRISQLMCVLCLPVTAVLMFFSEDLLFLWTGSPEAARIAAPVVSILAAGTALNGLLYVPYALQLAFAWTTPGLVTGVVYAASIGPAIIVLTRYWGLIGAASTWMILNFVTLVFVTPLVHRRLLGAGFAPWLLGVVKPMAGAVAVVVLCRALWPATLSSFAAAALVLGISFLGGQVAAILLAPQMRALVWAYARRAISLRAP